MEHVSMGGASCGRLGLGEDLPYVCFGGVPECAAAFEGAVEELEALCVGEGGAVEGGEAHEAEAELGNKRAVFA